MERIWQKLKDMKGGMKSLNAKEFSNVENRINDLRKQLEAVQIQLRSQHSNPDTYAHEKDIKLGLEKLLNVEESTLRQKSRVQWLNLRDASSAYIFASMEQRVSQNYIRSNFIRLYLVPGLMKYLVYTIL